MSEQLTKYGGFRVQERRRVKPDFSTLSLVTDAVLNPDGRPGHQTFVAFDN